MLTPHPTLALLAGGAGTRMGLPKSHLTLAGQPILQYLLSRLQWPGPTLLITTPGLEHPPGAHLFTHEATDPIAAQGPLRGLLTALKSSHFESADNDILVITTVDMPNVRSGQLEHLANELAVRPQALGLMFRSPSIANAIEPFPCAFRRAACTLIAARLATEYRSVQGLASHPAITLLPAPSDWPAETWVNLNTPEDLARFSSSRP